jgi:hypothetical protein
MYEPTLGRWMEPDPNPTEDGGTYVNGMSRYQVERGNPISHLDPLGLFVSDEVNQIGNAFDAVRAARSVAERNAQEPSFWEIGWDPYIRWAGFVQDMGGFSVLNEYYNGKKDGPPPSLTPNKMPFPRYIYTCRAGLIDLRHFYQLMYIASLTTNGFAVAQGIKHEEGAEVESRFAPEDITSNALGAYFGANILGWKESPQSFADKLRQFLQKLDPLDWTKLTKEQKDVIVDYYAIDRAGNRHRSREVGNDRDCCGACNGHDMSFPFGIDKNNPAVIAE